jgi:hypothetical protein
MTLESILAGIGIAAELVSGVVPGPTGVLAGFAAKLARIAQAANAAHIKITGEPIDLNKLHEV